MRLLDRYIFRSALFTCLAAVGLFAFVLMLGNAIRDLLGYILAGQLPFGMFVRLLVLLVLFVISYALPMGVLTGVLLTLGRLSADNEITAMRAAGVGLPRIARPILLLGALGVLAALEINFEIMPRARVRYHAELAEAVRANPLNFVVPRTFIRDFPNYVVYVGQRQGTVLRDLWLWQLDAKREVTRLAHAQTARIIGFDRKTNEFLIVLEQAQAETRDAKDPESFAAAPDDASFERSDPLRLPLNKLLGPEVVRQKLAWMTYAELKGPRGLEEALEEEGGDRRRAVMRVAFTIQDKLNSALAVLSFAFIGVPLGVRVSRRETSANLGLAVFLALGYYFLTVAIGWLDRQPWLRPDLLIWLPNLGLALLAFWLFRRIYRR